MWPRAILSAMIVALCLIATGTFAQEIDPPGTLATSAESQRPDLSCADLLDQAAGAHNDRRFEESLRLFERARPLTRSQREQAKVASGIGAALLGLGRLDAAEKSFKDALALAVDENSHALYNNIGVIHSRRREFNDAITYFGLARSLAGDAADQHGQAISLVNELRALVDHMDLGFRDLIDVAIVALARLPPGAERARLQVSMASVLHDAERLFYLPKLRHHAHSLLIEAKDTATGLDHPAILADAMGYLGLTYADDGQAEIARMYLERSTYEAQRTGREELSYHWDWQLAKLLVEMDELEAARDAYARAVNALNQVRNNLVNGSLEVFERRVQPVYVGYADTLLRLSATVDEHDRQDLLLLEARGALQDYKQAEIEDYFSSQCVADHSNQIASAEAGTAIIYPVLLPERIETIVETDKGLRQFTMPVPRRQVVSAIRKFRRDLQAFSTTKDYLKQARLLHGWLLRPLQLWLEESGVDTLVVVPDGPLRMIPLGALHDGEHFAVENYAIAITPSLRYTQLSQIENRRGNVLIGGLSEGVQGFAPLPYVREEISQLAATYSSSILVDADFKISRVREAMTDEGFSIVHLATHGEFKSDFRQSFLLTHDARLTFAQLQETLQTRLVERSPLDLIVLSACSTAMGDDRAALGLAGVAIQSGAKSALASLWSVSDSGTSQLMSMFYGNLQAGHSKAQSLRRAQRNMIEDTSLSHPALWAPFILVGGWQ